MGSIHKIYWTEANGSDQSYQTADMVEAIEFAAHCRKQGHAFVAIASEHAGMVGQLGTDGVLDGKLPNGDQYEWKKRRK